MAKLFCKRQGFYVLLALPRYPNCILRNIALPNIPSGLLDKYADSDVLKPLRRHVVCTRDIECVLAGQPRRMAVLRQEIREEVLRRWGQRPKQDIQKEWLKNAIYY